MGVKEREREDRRERERAVLFKRKKVERKRSLASEKKGRKTKKIREEKVGCSASR